MDEYSLIFFAGPADLVRAAAALAAVGLSVRPRTEALEVTWTDSRVRLTLTLARGPMIAAAAREFGEGTEFAARLDACDARFEIAVDDLDLALDETNTLIQTQQALLDLTGGVLYNTWNGRLSVP